MWPFRKHHKPEEAPAVAEAQEAWDEVMDKMGETVKEVDRVHDQIVADYEAAEDDLKR